MYIADQFRLDGKVSVITGAAGLLGRQHASAIAEMGGIPVLVDICEKSLQKASKILSRREHKLCVCDISVKDEVENLLNLIKNDYGKVDILINNAAINPKVEDTYGLNNSLFEYYPIETLQKEINVGLIGAFLCTQQFGRYMAKSGGGVVLNIASDLGIIGPNQNIYKKEGLEEHLQSVKPVSYSLIKHSLIGLTRYTATYWADKGVRCNALAPGGVENGQNMEFLKKIANLIPMGRLARVEEYKAAVVFLVSEASSYMNGAVVSIDGGRTCW